KARVSKDQSNKLFIGLHTMIYQSTLWNIVTLSEYILVNSDHSKNVIKKTNPSTFGPNDDYWGKYLLEWNELMDKDKGFIKDDKINVEIHFSVTNMKGIRKTPRIDFTDPNDPTRDVSLVINGEKIHVNKAYLALHSPFFKAMFYENFKEKNKSEIELK
ncbi:hypothetical protein PENTCL1PPCAC_23841, partial [Pristionchus entomophagus]